MLAVCSHFLPGTGCPAGPAGPDSGLGKPSLALALSTARFTPVLTGRGREELPLTTRPEVASKNLVDQSGGLRLTVQPVKEPQPSSGCQDTAKQRWYPTQCPAHCTPQDIPHPPESGIPSGSLGRTPAVLGSTWPAPSGRPRSHSPAQVPLSPARSPHPPLAGHVPASDLGQRPPGGPLRRTAGVPGRGSGRASLHSSPPARLLTKGCRA